MTADKVKKEYCRNCWGCKLSQGSVKPDVGGAVINLNGNWILNQYGGSEGFLGWLALQPDEHISHLKDLGKDESNFLGPNIKEIEKALQEYWAVKFDSDPIERVYAICFSEYSDGHLHFHLVPRTKKIADLLKDEGSIIPWNIYKIRGYDNFPQEYLLNCENVELLMGSLLKRIPGDRRHNP